MCTYVRGDGGSWMMRPDRLESIAIDKVTASDEKVDPVDCVDKSYAGIEVCQLCRVCLSQSL